MKHLKHLLIASTVTALCACNNTKESPVSLQWEMVKNGAAPGFYESSFTITNTSTKPLESDWEIYYTQLSPRQVKVNEDSPVIIEMINAGYYKIAPSESWSPLAPGDSIKISYLNQGIFTQTLFTPKSPFFVTNQWYTNLYPALYRTVRSQRTMDGSGENSSILSRRGKSIRRQSSPRNHI